MTILPQLESELLGAHARRAARRGRWRPSSHATPGALAIVLGAAAAIAVTAVAIVLVRHGTSGGGAAAHHPPPATSPPPAPPSLPANPTRTQQREEHYLFLAEGTAIQRCDPTWDAPNRHPTISEAAPSSSLLSILGVLRRPARATDKLPTRVVGRDHQVIPNGSLPPVQNIYVRYIRRARWRFGAGYYIVPAANVNQTGPIPAACYPAQRKALERELAQIPRRQRAAVLALEPSFQAQMRSSSEPHEGICLLALNSTGGGDVECGSTASDIEQGNTTGTGGPTGVPVAYGVVPDGVATVTLYYGPRSFTVHSIGNVWILPLHGPQPQDGFPNKIVWRSATGAVVKTVAGV